MATNVIATINGVELEFSLVVDDDGVNLTCKRTDDPTPPYWVLSIDRDGLTRYPYLNDLELSVEEDGKLLICR